MATQTVGAERAQFDRDGFYIFRNVLDEALLERLRAASEASLAEQDEQHFAEQVATGSMILVNGPFIERYPVFAEFIAHPGILQTLDRLGFADPKFGHGRVISKPPHSPPLFWHEDGRFWDDPVSYTPVPIQAFLMSYLTDTTPENGCLRVDLVPGSHLKRHALHDLVPESHTQQNRLYSHAPSSSLCACSRSPASSSHPGSPVEYRPHARLRLCSETPPLSFSYPAFAHYEDEIDVPLRAGDCVAGYGTLFHSSHANDSDTRRTYEDERLTMWRGGHMPTTATPPAYYPARTSRNGRGLRWRRSSTACSSATTYRRRSPKCCAGSRSATTATPN